VHDNNNNKNNNKNNNNNNNNNNTQGDIYSAIINGGKPYARVHFGFSERKPISSRWPPTRRPSCKLEASMAALCIKN